MTDTRRTTAVPSANPHHDARVIWSGDGKRIVVDNRPKPQVNFHRKTKVIGLKDVLQKSIDKARAQTPGRQTQNEGKG